MRYLSYVCLLHILRFCCQYSFSAHTATRTDTGYEPLVHIQPVFGEYARANARMQALAHTHTHTYTEHSIRIHLHINFSLGQ